MSAELYDVAIIGAGLTGLTLGWEISEKNPALKVCILEKSKGCGGRMATRRINESKFDHGAQFIKESEVSGKWINLWQQEDVAFRFPSKNFSAYCGKGGITQLAKALAKHQNIFYEAKVAKLSSVKMSPTSTRWSLSYENGQNIFAKDVVITSPLPQSLELLENSRIRYDEGLKCISYSSAIVVLVEGPKDSQFRIAYQDNVSDEIYSICDQKLKGNSERPAWTVVMTSEWSRLHFEFNEDQILENATRGIKSYFPNLPITQAHLKKWKYCQPINTWKKTFDTPAPHIHLAGDAFGGPSLQGALRSAKDLFEYLNY